MDERVGEDATIKRLIQWASQRPDVRAMILTSSRTSPMAPVDLLSDYDVIVAVNDVRPYFESRAWLEDFGPLLVLYRDPLRLFHGLARFACITQYEDGLKIDFTLWTAGILPRVAAEPTLPDELDVGYAVLLDKANLAKDLRPPTYQAHIPKPPAEAQYLEAIELFFHEATYAAKYLWRDDLVAAKDILDHGIKVGYLRQMLEWMIEIDHGWTLKPGAYGRYLKHYLRPAIWNQLEETYVGASLEENWRALFKTADLFRLAAQEVGEYLGYTYPADLDRRATAYLEWVRSLDRQASPLALERRRLVVEAGRFEPLLADPNPTSIQTDAAIEELRAIRMRIHAIDRQLAQAEQPDDRGD
ncbi:MAG TPA: aminoglycoside 6-adenylyltransferase [Anaerolineae bacterium]|nr:aminoglycoside 6-adenylyltransferase [Anaerolineae bacterium]